jgi:hypothetical protein
VLRFLTRPGRNPNPTLGWSWQWVPLFLVSSYAVWTRQGTASLLWTLALGVVLIAVVYLRARDMGVHTTDHDIEAVNFFTTRRWPWPEVADFELRPVRFVRGRAGCIVLRSGARYAMTGVFVPNAAGSEQQAQARARLEELKRELAIRTSDRS